MPLGLGVNMNHLDRTYKCALCKQKIHIPHNVIGGYWHLSGWENKHGLKFTGGFCSDCFDKLLDVTEPIQDTDYAGNPL